MPRALQHLLGITLARIRPDAISNLVRPGNLVLATAYAKHGHLERALCVSQRVLVQSLCSAHKRPVVVERRSYCLLLAVDLEPSGLVFLAEPWRKRTRLASCQPFARAIDCRNAFHPGAVVGRICQVEE